MSLDFDSLISEDLVLPTELVVTRGFVICRENQQYCSFDVFLKDDQVSSWEIMERKYIGKCTCCT